MMKYIVRPIFIGRIIIGSLIMSIATSSFIMIVRAASLQEKRIDHMRGTESEEKIHSGFSSMSGVDSFEKYGIQQRMETEYRPSHLDRKSFNETETNNVIRVHQKRSYFQATEFPPSRNDDKKENPLEAHLKTLGNVQESGRSFTVIHTFLKTMKKTLKSLRPEIKLSECAQRYFFSTSKSETSGKPTHNHGHTHDKKKKKKHKDDPHKDYSDHITDGVVSSVFGLHSDFASIIYEEYRPYLHIARSVYKNVKSTFEVLRQDALMKCTVDYLVARFCIWVDG